MFGDTDSFNHDISSWDVSNVTDMSNMFRGAVSFNQDIRSWDVSNVTNVSNMFRDATAMISTYGSDAGFGETPEASWFSGASSDSTAPTISSVSIASNNSTTTEGFAGDEVTLTFTADEPIGTPTVTFKSGGDAVTDTSISYANDSGNTWTATYTVNASDTAGAVTYSIAFSDSAGNAGTAITSGSGSVTIYPTPAIAFATELTDINAKIASFAQAELNNLSSTMSGISSSARSRFMSKMQGSEVKVSSSAPDYSGSFNASGGKINTNLSVTQSSKSPSALYTTYTSSDVFFNRLDDGSQSTGVASQIQFERLLNDSTMLGYFIGGSVGLMNEGGTLTTSMEAVGIQLGSYFVRELEGNLILDGYASVVTSQNSLHFKTDIMNAKSNYSTQAGALGLNLTGSIPYGLLEIRPTGSLSLTRSIGQTVNFDVAVGSSTSTETAIHGSINQTKFSFAPEVRMPFSMTPVATGRSTVATLTPKLTCQQLVKTTTTRNCGQGIALGLDIISKDGLTNITVGTSYDQIGGQSSTSVKLKVMKQW
jgi:surface protein